MKDTAYLILQNGNCFSSSRYGATGDITAELVFNTSMTGYLETITDPSYHGQMVVQTFPLIGNYGVIPDDFESAKPRLSAFIVTQVCEEPSNFRNQGNLDAYLMQTGVIGLSGLDTRALTKIIREYGVMNAAIVSKMPSNLPAFIANLAQSELSSDVYQVTCPDSYTLNENGNKHIVLCDYGYKKGMSTELIKRGCRVTIMPAGRSAKEILALNPDGILLSNGPGDPAVNTAIISQIKLLMESCVPIFGICLGHQLMGIAQGATSIKLAYGHRGANQPVRDTSSGHLYITSQNHGYSIKEGTLPDSAVFRFININDNTCEGIDYLNIPAFSVQFHPEARGGPLDTAFLFDRFMNMLK